MVKEFEGKKLLVLGGVRPACEIVKEAQKMGAIVYVTDYLEDSPAKKVANKSFMVSATDVDAVVNLCKEEKIDGVITGYVDLLLPYCEEICKKLGLPFWGNKENIDVCINKEKFKLACENAGVSVVPWKKVTLTNLHSSLADIELPVVVKPTDNSGSRGVFKCYSQNELEENCNKAFEFSESKELLVEKLMNYDNEFSVYYLLNNGDYYLTGMGDRFVYNRNIEIAPIGQGMLFPSKRLNSWKTKMDSHIKDFFRLNQMYDGFVFFQGFEENDEFYIHEIGFRMNGGFSYKVFENMQGYNQLQEMIRFSLTGNMKKSELNKASAFINGNAFILTVSLLPGEIKSVDGIEDIVKLDGVVEFCQLHNIGETLLSQGTTAQVFAYIILTAKDRDELCRIIEQVNSMLKVTGRNGENLVSKMVDTQRVREW